MWTRGVGGLGHVPRQLIYVLLPSVYTYVCVRVCVSTCTVGVYMAYTPNLQHVPHSFIGEPLSSSISCALRVRDQDSYNIYEACTSFLYHDGSVYIH